MVPVLPAPTVPHERPASPGGRSPVSPAGSSRRTAPDDCDQGLFETVMQRCSIAWRCCCADEPASIQETEEVQVHQAPTLLGAGVLDGKAAIAEAPTSDVKEWQWEFKADGPGWQPYPVEVNRCINEAYRAGQPQVEVPSNHIIVFAQGRQVNRSDISRWRAVRSQK